MSPLPPPPPLPRLRPPASRHARAVTLRGGRDGAGPVRHRPVGHQRWLRCRAPPEWLVLSVLAVAFGRLSLRVPGVPVHASMSDTFLFTSAMLSGRPRRPSPWPPTGSSCRGGAATAPTASSSTPPTRRCRCGSARRASWRARPRAAGRRTPVARDGGGPAGGHGRAALPPALGADGHCRGARARLQPVRGVAAALCRARLSATPRRRRPRWCWRCLPASSACWRWPPSRRSWSSSTWACSRASAGWPMPNATSSRWIGSTCRRSRRCRAPSTPRTA